VTALSTAYQARSVASDVLCRSHPFGPAFAGPRTRRQVPSPRPLRQKRPLRWNQDAFPRRIPPPPPRLASAETFASGLRPAQLAPCLAKATGSRAACHRDHGVSTKGPASSVLSPPERKAGWPDPNGFLASLRLTANGTFGPDAVRRFLQPAQPASTAMRPPDPRLVPRTGHVQLALDWEKPPEGVEAPSAQSAAESG